MINFNRRSVLLALASTLAGCARPEADLTALPHPKAENPASDSRYQALPDEPFPIAALATGEIRPELLRQTVPFQTQEPVGAIVVDPHERFLYLVQEGGVALRYGVGVGREGLEWSGRAVIARKAAWPRWTPTARMIARDPRNAQWANGMPPGLNNPLGARALYLYRNGVDTMYRLHGTNEPESIGEAVSSGCIRLFNHDVIDLHRRTPLGAAVVVLAAGSTSIS